MPKTQRQVLAVPAQGWHGMPRISINEMTTYHWSLLEDVISYQAAGIRGIGVWRRKLCDFGEERGIELLREKSFAAESAVVSHDLAVETESYPINPQHVLAAQGGQRHGGHGLLCAGSGARRRRGAGHEEGGDAGQDRCATTCKAPVILRLHWPSTHATASRQS